LVKQAEAMSLEAISPSGDKTAVQEIVELQEKALALFQEVRFRAKRGQLTKC